VMNLAEAKLKLLKLSIVRLGWALVFVVIAAFLSLAATGFFLLGLYQSLSSLFSPAGASFLVALAAFILALFFAFLAKSRTTDL
jgi:hypothetical protein